MSDVKKVNDDLSIAGQISSKELQPTFRTSICSTNTSIISSIEC
jgi:protein tyrosine phosphatase (PTP) superfamily phosphohydrolase (DUF442 family)